MELRPMYRMYRFYDARGALLYVGQTGRLPWQRLLEHVCGQPWADRMARWEVDPRAFATLDEVLTAERAAIRSERPVYNWLHNERNPYRRWAGPPRSATRRESPGAVGTPVASRGRNAWPRRGSRARERRGAVTGRRWHRARPAAGWRSRRVRQATAGLLAGAGSAWASGPLPVTGADRLLIGAVVAAAVVVWLRGTTARYRRRLARRAATVGLAVVAGYVAWRLLPALAV